MHPSAHPPAQALRVDGTPLTNAITIVAAANGFAVILATGEVVCWGLNHYGTCIPDPSLDVSIGFAMTRTDVIATVPR